MRISDWSSDVCSSDLAYAESPRADYVGGGFSDPGRKGVRAYFIGKYEVTRAQLGAFDDPCRKVTGEDRLLAVSVTWAEAAHVAARYPAGLFEDEAAASPSERDDTQQGKGGFVHTQSRGPSIMN